MNPNKEYTEFQIKFAKHLSDIQDDYEKLSPQARQLVDRRRNYILWCLRNGTTIETIVQILQKY